MSRHIPPDDVLAQLKKLLEDLTPEEGEQVQAWIRLLTFHLRELAVRPRVQLTLLDQENATEEMRRNIKGRLRENLDNLDEFVTAVDIAVYKENRDPGEPA